MSVQLSFLNTSQTIHSIMQFLLHVCARNVLGARDTAMNQRDQTLCPRKAYSLVGVAESKLDKVKHIVKYC